jgi:uncharacterized membrane protein YhaH (DUF805 family)
MRYRGAGRSMWPILLAIIIAVIVLAAIYVVFFAPR